MRATSKSWTAGVGCLLAASCGGRALPPAGAVFTDGSRLKAIWPSAAADGSLRCLPTTGTSTFDLFAAAGCTGRGAAFELPPLGCAAPAPAVAATFKPGPSGCGQSGRYRMYSVAGPHVGAIYWLLGTSCIDASDLFDGDAVFDLGNELPPDAFAPIATSDHYPAR